MGVKSVVQIVLETGSLRVNGKARRKATLAWINLAGSAYFLMMASLVTGLGIFEVLPTLCCNTELIVHVAFAVFLFVHVIGNSWNIYTTDPRAIPVINAIVQEVHLLSDRFLIPEIGQQQSVLSQRTARLHGGEDQTGVGSSHKYKLILQDPVFGAKFTKSFCKICAIPVPKRSHHCILCNACILGRDHHCYFLCSCIGYNNQKYFLIFCFYMGVAAFYSSYMGVRYFNVIYDTRFSISSAPFTLLPSVLTTDLTSCTGYKMTLVGIFYGCCCGGMVSTFCFIKQMHAAYLGITTRELNKTKLGMHSVSDRGKFKVLGPYWYVLFLVPIQLSQGESGLYGEAEPE